MTTPLSDLLRACTPAEREWLAQRAGTTVNYLYAMAGCHRERISATLALAIEDSSTELAVGGKTPIVTAREIASMCLLARLPA